MKQTQRDIKYIIKRILIGVGIAIILFNLKKCNVYADSNVRTFANSTNNATAIWNYSTQSGNCAALNYNNSNDTFNYGGYEYNVCWYAANNPGKKMTIAIEFNNNLYVLYGNLNAIPDSSYYIDITSTSSEVSIVLRNNNNQTIGFSGGTLPYYANTYFHDGTSDTWNYNFTKINVDENITHTNVQQLSPTDIYYNYSNFSLVYNTYNLPVYINDQPVLTNPLENYTEVDITGKQAILIVPKNYLNLSNISYEYDDETDKHFIIYKYGSQRCVRPTLIDLNNFDDFALNGSWLLGFANSSDIENIQEVCHDSPTLQSFTGLYTSPELQATDSPYNYMGLLIYNSSRNYDNNSPNWVNNQDVPYGANSVWVDASLYNYYLVDDFNNFNQTISFINGNGENESLYIESLPTFTDLMEKTKNQQSIDDNLSTRQKINELLSLVKIPFDFLKGIITGTCEPLYAPFPHSNQNIILPCMSNAFSDILTPAGYLSLRVLINGLLVYRIIIALIIFTENSLDPSDARIEVLDL